MQVSALVLLTFREMWARKIVGGLFIISTLVWLTLAFALNLDIVEGSLAGLRIFGQDAMPSEAEMDPETSEQVRDFFTLDRVVIQVQKAVAAVAYWAGILLALFATASLLPSLLATGRVDVLLSKPISRVRLLGSHLLGVLLTMVFLATYLFGMVWLVMSMKTGIWDFHFFKALFVVVGMFGVLYSVVAFIGVTARNAPLALIVSYGLVIVSLVLAAKEQLAPQINLPWRYLYLGLYHLLPAFGEVTGTVLKLTSNEPVGSLYPFFSSLLFGAVFLVGAFFFIRRRDF